MGIFRGEESDGPILRGDPAKDITKGVTVLLHRLQTEDDSPELFWQLHGAEKIDLWLAVSDRFETPTPRDVDALRRLQQEMAGVSTSLKALSAASKRDHPPDRIRSLVFSNIITYLAERGLNSVTEMASVYEKVLRTLGFAPHWASAPAPAQEEENHRTKDDLVSGPKTAEAVSDKDGPISSDSALAGPWPKESLHGLAFFMKGHLWGIMDRFPGPLRDKIMAFEEPYRQLEALARRPDQWPMLPKYQLQLLVFEQCLHLALTNDLSRLSRVMPLQDLYRTAVERMSVSDRMDLESNVAMVLESHHSLLDALTPFFYDPAVAVVSMAAQDLALLMPLTNGDPMTGPKEARALADAAVQIYELTAIGIYAGILSLGDRRVLPVLDGCWAGLSAESQRQLALHSSGVVFASQIEFLLRWLESIQGDDEDAWSPPATALARLPETAVQESLIQDVEWRFPARHAAAGAEDQATPAMKVLRQWTIEEYARMIEPRLRQILVRAPRSDYMRKVFEVWLFWIVGSEPAYADSAATLDALRHLADDISDKPHGETPDERARSAIAGMFSTMSPPQALALLKSTSEMLTSKAIDLERQAQRESDPLERETFLTEARNLSELAQATTFHLREHLGDDLNEALSSMMKAQM